MKILFLCRGNVARSQMAQELLKKMKPNSFEVSSAGTKLSGPEQVLKELCPALDNVLIAMKEEGVNMSENVRKQVTEEMANGADKIILVVDERDPIPEYLINNPKVTKWDVLDPKGQDLEFTRNVRDRIKELVIKTFI